LPFHEKRQRGDGDKKVGGNIKIKQNKGQRGYCRQENNRGHKTDCISQIDGQKSILKRRQHILKLIKQHSSEEYWNHQTRKKRKIEKN
jgi:hypothetical protein